MYVVGERQLVADQSPTPESVAHILCSTQKTKPTRLSHSVCMGDGLLLHRSEIFRSGSSLDLFRWALERSLRANEAGTPGHNPFDNRRRNRLQFLQP